MTACKRRPRPALHQPTLYHLHSYREAKSYVNFKDSCPADVADLLRRLEGDSSLGIETTASGLPITAQPLLDAGLLYDEESAALGRSTPGGTARQAVAAAAAAAAVAATAGGRRRSRAAAAASPMDDGDDGCGTSSSNSAGLFDGLIATASNSGAGSAPAAAAPATAAGNGRPPSRNGIKRSASYEELQAQGPAGKFLAANMHTFGGGGMPKVRSVPSIHTYSQANMATGAHVPGFMPNPTSMAQLPPAASIVNPYGLPGDPSKT